MADGWQTFGRMIAVVYALPRGEVKINLIKT